MKISLYSLPLILRNDFLAYLIACLLASFLIFLIACMLSYLLTRLFGCFFAYFLTCLLASYSLTYFLPAYLLTCLFACIYAYLLSCSLPYCHTRAPSWILSQAENLASGLQDGATKWYYFLVWTTPHPPTAKLFL